MKNKNVIMVGIISFIVIVAGISIPTYKVYSKVKSFDNYIYPTVKINGEDVSGKTVEEAKKLLSDKYQTPIGDKKINVKVNDKIYKINYSQIDANYGINNAVEQAFNYGRDKNIIDKYKLIKNPVLKSIQMSFNYNSKPIDNFINTIQKDVNIAPKDASVVKNGNGFQVTPDVDGSKLNTDELNKNIIVSINGNLGEDTNVQGNMEVEKAKRTKEILSTINTQISTFSTNYGSISGPSRVNNIQLATNTITGLVLMPGDNFSFNGVVGQRTAAKGYQSAPVDIGTQTSQGLGGGICQVSTTLYNAVLLAGIKATERMHHTIHSLYVPLGYDATVDWDNLDYQFKNTLPFPIYIEGSSANGTETFNIYSNSSLLSKNYKVVSNAGPGLKVKVYLQTYQNGQMIGNDLIANDTYSK
jgi:vancomycin resistance protein YoaR